MERATRAGGARNTRRPTADRDFSKPARPRGGDAPTRTGIPAWLHVLALAAAVLAGILAFPLASDAVPAPGAIAPDFVLKDMRGANQRLSEFRGDLVVLSFWTSACGDCRETLGALRGLAAGANAPVVISVNIDGDGSRGASVARSLDTGFATLFDTRQIVARLYDISHLPLTLLIDREGVVRGAWARDANPTDELLEKLRELQRQ